MAINDQAPIKSILIKNGNDWDQFPLSATVAAEDVTVDPVYDERDDLQSAYDSDIYLEQMYDTDVTQITSINYVPTSRQIAGIALTNDITRAALKTALSVSKSDVGLSNVTNEAQIPLSGSTAIAGTVGYDTSATATTVADGTIAFRNIVILTSGANDPSGTSYAEGTIIMKRKT